MAFSEFQVISAYGDLRGFGGGNDVGIRQHLSSGRESRDTSAGGRPTCDSLRFRSGSRSAYAGNGSYLLCANMHAMPRSAWGWIWRMGLSGCTKTGRPEVNKGSPAHRPGDLRYYQRWSCRNRHDWLEAPAIRSTALADSGLFTNIVSSTAGGYQ